MSRTTQCEICGETIWDNQTYCEECEALLHISDCCQAPLIGSDKDICSECKEHCTSAAEARKNEILFEESDIGLR